MVKKLLSKIFEKFGYSLSKSPINVGEEKLKYNFFKQHQWVLDFGFRTILDIGANKGQFASRFRALFPEAFIYSFEPIPEVFDVLSAKFEPDKKFKAFNFALGLEAGTIDFYQNNFSDSSSILKMNQIHKSNFPQTQNEKKIQIEVRRLDEVAEKLELNGPLLIKIDVQGFEEQVIFGGKHTIKKAELVIIEVSFTELYENQVYFDRIYSHMKELGFDYIGSYEQLRSPINGQILQADAIFCKR